MKFVVVSDTHLQHHRLQLPAGDVIVHAGDLTDTGRMEEVVDFLDWFRTLDFKYKIFIAGNHDFYLEKISHTSQEKELLPPGIHYLNDTGITIEGIKIWGSPVQPQFFNWAFNRKRGMEIQKHWDMIPDDTHLLITHGPPYDILDINNEGENVGCRNLLDTVTRIKPAVHVFGHIHEAYGRKKLNGTDFMNASILNSAYHFQNKPHCFEI
ncbi:MAG TPA: metallophosphatase domain-containing protein [Flavitalea sp.]|nr:metallophosphatase domain-containing protein [Flavitalea sp.]